MGKIILLTGKTKAGKDQLAQLLKDNWFSFERVAFADKLKAAVAHAKNISVEELEANKETHRPDLILAGKVGRYLDPLMWIKTVFWDSAKVSNLVVTDVRFKNEWDFILTQLPYEVIKVRIKATDYIRTERGGNPAIYNDESEIGLDQIPDKEFDYIVENNTNNLEILDADARYMIEHIF